MTAFTEARERVSSAASSIGEAVSILREAGMTDTADELAREQRMILFHVHHLDKLDNAPDVPGIEAASSGRLLRQAEGVEPI